RTRKPPAGPPPRDALRSLRALLDALPPDEVKAPRVPIGSLMAEALALSDVAEAVRDALLAKGLDPDHLDHLPVLARSLEMAQAELDASRGPRRSEEDLALEARALALRSDLVAAGRFALRADPAAQAELDAVRKGKGLDDLARDLRALADFAERHARALAQINAEPARQAALARELSATLAAKLARRRGSPDGTSEVREVRDRIATLLIDTMAEIRAAGAYAFRKDPAQLAKFRSPYNGEKRGRRPRADEPLATPPAPPPGVRRDRAPSRARAGGPRHALSVALGA
ncbi:MAG TPA: hypothetical protein VFS00_16560, partial [Polyangiaceae bacterium]|nr:hypothetical protein [Polyangiaceae bacterium]